MFKVDFINGKTIAWSKKDSKIKAEQYRDYSPRFYVGGDTSKLQKSRSWLSQQEGVEATCFEKWKPTLSKPEKRVLRIDTSTNKSLKSTANRLKKKFGRSTFRFYNIGFSPQFRFCLQQKICPVPEHSLSRIEVEMSRKAIADNKLSEMKVNGQKLAGNKNEAFQNFQQKWMEKDPDIVLVSSGQVLEILNTFIQENDSSFSLGRLNKFQQLAGENTVSSYGRTVHSSARYNIPGRIVIDKSNSFLLKDATLPGLWDLVKRSYRPMQELAWGSIGRVLTSIEVRKAYLEENTLTPWKNWSGEKPKKASTLHKADRGGFIFNPEPGIHHNIYEADFASLFPNIMIKKNISPETVCCSCCNNSKTPELNYSICEKQRGFISEVLKPLVEDRQEMKEKIDNIDNQEKKKDIQGSIDAIKWLLVSCFGYMGHAHASYGAIRCHQAIQAFDREIMIEAKEIFEGSGYRITHGIIDSIWVEKKESCEKFTEVCKKISKEIGIKLEPEHQFEWCAFVPRTSSKPDISTLNRYFGKKKSGEFKTAGIEVEQRSTCEFVKEAQMDMIKALDRNMEVKDVVDVLKEKIKLLEERQVDSENLIRTRRVSKKSTEYKVENRGFTALKRAEQKGVEVKPGESVKFIVRDDSASSLDRVRMNFEENPSYDVEFYRKKLLKAAESIVSPLKFSKADIEKMLTPEKTLHLDEI